MRPISWLFLFAALTVSPASAQVTYSREVSRILQEKCQICHRPNDIAPFALMSYQDAALWAEDIGRVLESRAMPPWKPMPGHGDFRNSYALSDDERQVVLNWISAGAPEGDPADLPTPVERTSEWQNGEPDHTLTMESAFDVPRLQDLYRCFVLPTGLEENRHVEAVEVRPGVRSMVHHVLLYLDESGESERLDAEDAEPGYNCFGGPKVELSIGSLLGAWVPGARINPLPEGVGILLPGRARIVMQIHYNRGGQSDQTQVGLYFSKQPVSRRLITFPLANTTFRLNPGDVKDVPALLPIPPFFDAKVYQIGPHMHLLGRKVRIDMRLPDGTEQPLIRIDDWDFNWQGFYSFQEPVSIPAGALLRMTCTFDNTEQNPRNPSNPLRTVRWGEGTEDEMCLGYLGVTLNNERLLSLLPRL